MGVARGCEELVRDGWLVKMRGDRLGVERMREDGVWEWWGGVGVRQGVRGEGKRLASSYS